MTHTPGPWIVSRCDDGYLMVHTEGYIICHPDPNHGPGDPQDEVNFGLIVAAPDMLAALQHVEAVMTIVVPRSHTAEYVETLHEVRTAIAKATGATPAPAVPGGRPAGEG